MLVLAIAQGCGGGGGSSSTATTSVPASASTDAEQDASPFVAAGIAITSIDAPAAGSGLTLTDWQADNLLRAADNGAGLTGTQMRERFPSVEGEMPIDLIVAAWVLEGGSPIAELAAGLMPTLDFEDPADVVIPSAVVVLFTHELMVADGDGNPAATLPATDPVIVSPIEASQLETLGASSGFGAGRRVQPPIDQPAGLRAERNVSPNLCSALLVMQETVLGKVFDALGGKDSFLGKKAQIAIGLLPKPAAAFAVPGKGTLDVLMTLGFIASLVGSVSPWTVTMDADTDPIAYGIAPAPGNRGTVRVKVDPGVSLDWPDALQSCASLLGVELPDVNPVGGIVQWTGTFGQHAVEFDQEGVIMDIDGVYQARYRFDTSVETAEQAAGALVPAAIVVEAVVDRPGNETFDQLIGKMISRYAGDGIIGSALQYLASGVAKLVTDMSDPPSALQFVTVTFHEPPPPTTPPTETTPVAGTSPTGEASGCVGVDLFSVAGDGMPAGVRVNLSSDGRVIFDFSASETYDTFEDGITVSTTLRGSLTGTWTQNGDSFLATKSSVNIVGTVTVLGVTTELPPEAFADRVATSESLSCLAGPMIVVDRTGQVYE
jgi:hypothetical protein